MVWQWRPGDWKRRWTGCWIRTTAPRATSGWRNICASSENTCLHFCTVRVWKEPIVAPSGPRLRAFRIRPAVIARKVWGGNRTWNGANVQQILMSVLRTFHQQGKDAFASLVELLRIPGHKILEIVPTPA